MSDVTRRLAAIVAIDVAGYSRLVGQDEEGMLEALRSHRIELIELLLKQHSGRIANTAGDSFLLEFPSAVAALRCAIAVQAGMAGRNKDVERDRRIEFRIGINVGDVLSEGDDLLGDGVNVAARIEGLAEAGGICLSRTARDQVRDRMDIDLHDMGEVEVKNIARPVRVFRVLAEGEAAKARPKQFPTGQTIVAAAALVLVIVISGGAWWWQSQPDFEPADPAKMAYALPDKPSIAVLPFDNLTRDKTQDYISDGFTENIIAVLSISPDLLVIARNSSSIYKGKPVKVQTVAEELGVRYVLEGSVQRDGDQLRVTAQLIDAVDGRHLWAKRYDRKLGDFFKIQDDITQEILVEMQVRLSRGADARTLWEDVRDLETYRLLFEAIRQFQRFDPEGHREAEKLLAEAYERQPDSPALRNMMGWIHWQKVLIGLSKNPGQSIVQARQFAESSGKRSYAYTLLAYISSFSRDHESALAHADAALKIAPRAGSDFPLLGLIKVAAGQLNEGIELLKLGLRTGPANIWIPGGLAHSLMLAGRYDEAEALNKRVIASPEYYSPRQIGFALQRQAIIAALRDDLPSARQYVQQVLNVMPNASVKGGHREIAHYKNQDIIERFNDLLRRAGLPEHPPETLPDKPSIAVLPFDNMSDDPKQTYFAHGMAEDIITDLSKISGLFVIARNSSFSYRGKNVDVKTIGRELGVRYVLEGSVRRAENKVRINAQLIDAQTRDHIWAERYDGDLSDVFDLQDRVTRQVVAALKVALGQSERDQVERKPTNVPEAYDLYLRARKAANTYDHKRFPEALARYEEAITLDPTFADAYAGLAFANYVVWVSSWAWVVPPPDALRRTREAAARAIALDENNALAALTLALVEMRQQRHDRAVELAQKVTELAPADGSIHVLRAVLLAYSGELEKASEALTTAARVEPRPLPRQKLTTAWALEILKRHKKAVQLLLEARIEGPDLNDTLISATLARNYAHLGEIEKAKSEIDRAKRSWPSLNYRSIRSSFGFFRNESDVRYLVEGLRKAGAPEWPFGFTGKGLKRLSGPEIKKLWGSTWIGSINVYGKNKKFQMEVTENGDWIFRAFGGETTGTNKIVDDQSCGKSPWLYQGRETCTALFRNPAGTAEQLNEFVMVAPENLYYFSIQRQTQH